MSKLLIHPNYIQLSKDKHKVINWGLYNKGLKERGSINIWISSDMIDQWNQPEKKGQRGRCRRYNDVAILCCLVIRKVYHLPLRQCEGFIRSFFKMTGIDKAVPDYTTLCRRASVLEVEISRLESRDQPIAIAIDSTGLKVYGEGEWKVRKHGYNKHRRWMKLNIGIDINSQQIELVSLTTNSVDDAESAKDMLSNLPKDKKISSFRGDGAYDKVKVDKELWKGKIDRIIPTQHNAVKSDGKKPWLESRDKTIDTIKQIGKEQWKQSVGYHKRSLAETAMYRYKTIIGDRLKSRKQQNQLTEARVSCQILNRMLLLAKPISVKVA